MYKKREEVQTCCIFSEQSIRSGWSLSNAVKTFQIVHNFPEDLDNDCMDEIPQVHIYTGERIKYYPISPISINHIRSSQWY